MRKIAITLYRSQNFDYDNLELNDINSKGNRLKIFIDDKVFCCDLLKLTVYALAI